MQRKKTCDPIALCMILEAIFPLCQRSFDKQQNVIFLAICIAAERWEEAEPKRSFGEGFDRKKSFQETHHHANCDRNGNELSNPRTSMKMVTSVACIKNRLR